MLILPFCASATYISLSSSVDLERVVNTTTAEANLSITNNGDEPAYDVIVEPVSYMGFTAGQLTLGNIKPNETISGTIALTIPEDALPGRYSMGLMIRYNDLNNYPFTFVTPLRLFYKIAIQSNVVGLLSEVEIAGDREEVMTLKIQNRDDKPHDVTVKLYTPNQISVDEKEKKVTLRQSSETVVDFNVSSLGALPGGNFFVFATIDYDDDGKHYSVISSNGRILTTKERYIMGMLLPVIVGAIVILVVVIVYLQLKPKKQAPAEAKEEKQRAVGKKK
ncbi:MAG: hypothetical protein FJY77_05030 [Candidatus Altiarchaeales archaeon]|nr:hypothetical protein [Candidatus Altiarchaeales archaeon]